MKDNPTFPELKQSLLDDVAKIKKYVEEGEKSRAELRVLVQKMHLKYYGDPDANPPVKGFDDRLCKLERVESERIKSKEYILKLTAGSLTVAIGGAVLWVCKAVQDAFLKGH